MSRILGFFKSKSESGPKGNTNTIKKPTPQKQTSRSHAVLTGSDLQSIEEESAFPRDYYKPRPVPKTFVVGGVRKMSNNGIPSNHDSPSSLFMEVIPEVTTISHHCAASTASGNRCACSDHSPMNSLDSSSSSEYSSPSSLETRGAPISKPLSKGGHEELHSKPTVDLLLGQQYPGSLYFTRRYFSLPDITNTDSVSNPPSGAIQHISELDPHAFELYKIYTQNGDIKFSFPEDINANCVWMVCWPLINAHILGGIIGESSFADRVMDELAQKLEPGVCPDAETLGHLFTDDKKEISTVLKQFVIDRFIDTQQNSPAVIHISNHPLQFKLLALQAALQRLSRHSGAIAVPSCKYHIHGASEACYRIKLRPIRKSRERRLAEAREKSARDAKVVLENVIHNGIKSIDWARHEADANRAFGVEDQRPCVEFRRSEDGKATHQTRSVQSTPNQAGGGTTDKCNSGQLSSGRDKVPLRNGAMSTFNLTKPPNNSAALPSESSGVRPTAVTTVVVEKNGESPPFQNVSPTKQSGHDSHVSTLAELDDSSVSGPLRISSNSPGRPSIVYRVPDTAGQTSSTLVVVNGMDGTDLNTQTVSSHTPASNRQVDKLTDKDVRCPGAYPESNYST